MICNLAENCSNSTNIEMRVLIEVFLVTGKSVEIENYEFEKELGASYHLNWKYLRMIINIEKKDRQEKLI